MQKKLVVTLVLIVLLPVAVLGWLGQRMAHNEQQVVEAQVQALVQAQLRGVDDAIQGYFHAVQGQLLERLRQGGLDNSSLKQWSLESTLVKHALVLAGDGKRLVPPPGTKLSDTEEQFIQRTSAVWDNPRLLTQGAALRLPVSALHNFGQGAAKSRSAQQIDARESVPTGPPDMDQGQPAMGWYTWHWNAQLHHMFWWRDPESRVIGLELAPVAVLSDIIVRLPTTGPDSDTTKATTRLINGSGQTVYEWGAYRPAAGERSLAMLPLSHPLASWKLEYFAPTATAGAVSHSLGVMSAVVSIALTLAALASYLYFEHSREVRLAQQRVNFVNQVSHELKTPLTNIRLYAELLETELDDLLDNAGPHEGDKVRNYIAIMTSESQRLSRLIANVLSLGQFQKSQQRLALQPARVDDVIARCLSAFQPALEAKAIAVCLQLRAGDTVMLDPQVLEQIVNNLISNVEKYAAMGGALEIESQQTAHTSSIDVRDFGPGIAPTERARIFNPFYRVSSKLTDGVAGTGIGLDIARQLARLHGGDVTLESSPRGAWFRIRLNTPPAKEPA